MPCHIDRRIEICVGDEPLSSSNPLPTSGGGGGGNVVVTDIKDGTGQSVMDPANDAIRVNVVAGGTGGTVLESPQRSFDSAVAVAAGSSTTLDSTQISASKTGHLLEIVVSSSVPFKVEVYTVTNGVIGSPVMVAFSLNRAWEWRAFARGLVSVSQDPAAGFDGFRTVVTNLDTSEPADVYAAFFWDETTGSVSDLTDPKTSSATVASVAAGSSVDLDSGQISVGKVGHLLQVVVGSSVPFKVEVQTVADGIASSPAIAAVSLDRNWEWRAFARGFIFVAQSAGAGLDGFRAVITNLDTSEPADVYAAFFWEEL